MQVYPALDLINTVKPSTPINLIDPNEIHLFIENELVMQKNADEGIGGNSLI